MTEPRILLWDIETAPALGWVWQKWQTDVLSFEQDWHMLTVAWKWLGEKQVQVRGLCDFELFETEPENDYELAKLAHELFSEADIVVAHNGMAFDTKKAQARMLFHKFDPPVPFKEVDTLKIARKHFAFTSNRLGDLCNHLGIGGKVETGGFQLWMGCIKGDEAAWNKMKRYNKHDVQILEKLYLRLRPWATGANEHASLAALSERPNACPRCGSTKGMIVRGRRTTTVMEFTRFQCRACRAYCSGRKSRKLDLEYVP